MKILILITLLFASIFSDQCLNEVVQLNKLAYLMAGCISAHGSGCSTCAICLPKVQRFVSPECTQHYETVMDLQEKYTAQKVDPIIETIAEIQTFSIQEVSQKISNIDIDIVLDVYNTLSSL